MTKKEFLNICKKYNLVTRQDPEWEGIIFINAYLPGMVYEPDDEDNDSFADFEAESWDDEDGRVKMYGGLVIEYDFQRHTTTYSYDNINTVDVTIQSEFEQIIAGVMERYNTMKLLDKKESERNKLIKLQSDFV